MSRVVTCNRVVLVALFLIGGARSAGAWQAMPGPPAVSAQEPPVVTPAASATPAPPPPARVPAAVRPRPVAPSVTIEQTPPPPLPPGAYGGEWSRGGGQLLLGTVTMAALVAVAVGLGNSDGGEAAVVIVLPAPLVAGYVVCRIGQKSPYFGGGCGAAIGGAYLGALTAIPLFLLVLDNCEPDPAYAGYEGRFGECFGPALFGAALGYTVGTALGATLGWHLGKDRRPAAAPHPNAIPPPPDPRPELGRGPAGSRPPGVRLSVPLLAFSF